MSTTHLLSNRVIDARAAMVALIDARSIAISEGDPEFAKALAALAWAIADAMAEQRLARSRKRVKGEK